LFVLLRVATVLTTLRRHFFHATEARRAEGSFMDDADEGEPGMQLLDDVKVSPSPEVQLPSVKEEPLDPALAAWFKPAGSSKMTKDEGSDTMSDTDPDSENDDVKEEDDDWEQVRSETIVSEFELVETEVLVPPRLYSCLCSY
jgi:hypothetical protein